MKISKNNLNKLILDMLYENKQLKINESFNILPLLGSVLTGCSGSDTEIAGDDIVLYELKNKVETDSISGLEDLENRPEFNLIYKDLDLKGYTGPITGPDSKGYSQKVLLFTKEVFTHASNRPIQDLGDYNIYTKQLYCLWNNIELPFGQKDMRIIAKEGSSEVEYYSKTANFFDDDYYEEFSKTKLGVIPSHLKELYQDVVLPIKMYVFISFNAVYRVPKNIDFFDGRQYKKIAPIGYHCNPSFKAVWTANHQNCYENFLLDVPEVQTNTIIPINNLFSTYGVEA